MKIKPREESLKSSGRSHLKLSFIFYNKWDMLRYLILFHVLLSTRVG